MPGMLPQLVGLVLAALDWTTRNTDPYFAIVTRRRALAYWLIVGAIMAALVWSTTWPHNWGGP